MPIEQITLHWLRAWEQGRGTSLSTPGPERHVVPPRRPSCWPNGPKLLHIERIGIRLGHPRQRNLPGRPRQRGRPDRRLSRAQARSRAWSIDVLPQCAARPTRIGRRHGSGPSACTTSGSGPRCAAAGISLRPKNPNSSPATSPCSLPTCRMADDRLRVVITGVIRQPNIRSVSAIPRAGPACAGLLINPLGGGDRSQVAARQLLPFRRLATPAILGSIGWRVRTGHAVLG